MPKKKDPYANRSAHVVEVDTYGPGVDIILRTRPRLADPNVEPPIGSVLMIQGLTGTAVQRMGDDGTYAATSGAEYPAYASLFERPGEVYLVHEAPRRN